MRTRMTTINVGFAAALLALPAMQFPGAAAEAKEASFSPPKWKGYRLDWCVNWSEDCGQPAADAFCKAKGFEYATHFAQDPRIGSLDPTRLIGTDAVCDQDMCDGFKYITCFKPGPRGRKPKDCGVSIGIPCR
jgi:hypothetical protein